MWSTTCFLFTSICFGLKTPHEYRATEMYGSLSEHCAEKKTPTRAGTEPMSWVKTSCEL